MIMKKNILFFFAFAVILFTSCNDFLDRPRMTVANDESFWKNESNLRMFVNGFYTQFFVGYSSSWDVSYTPLRGYDFHDDVTSNGRQDQFETQPGTGIPGTSETLSEHWNYRYGGNTYNFSWVRKCNILIDRIENRMKGKVLTDEAYNHWMAVGRFFRAFQYYRMVCTYGDIQYYDAPVPDSDLDNLYKDRDNRTFVADKIYDDLVFALDNMRTNDGANVLNRYIAAAFATQFMLFEGTWQKYHLNNTEKAKKYLELVVKAANIVMSSGNYAFTSDFRSLFGSFNLAGNKEVIMFRHYEDALVTHHIASYSNRYESQPVSPNLHLAKSFICTDGQPFKLSSVNGANKFDLQSMILSRDPRFEATFSSTPQIEAATLLYASKFIDRKGPTYYPGPYPPEYGSSTNTNDAPVIRLAEVVLNWIEAKAELAAMGGTAVTQADIDASINAIRSRPLDATATAKGVQKTKPLILASIPNDPDRDSDVSPLLWEIRRERRMEFVFEFSRTTDIRRWKKLHYLDYSKPENIDKRYGLWVNILKEVPQWWRTPDNPNQINASLVNKLRVVKADGTIVMYDGTNDKDMEGFYFPPAYADRNPPLDRNYLAPISSGAINLFEGKKYKLTQNPGW